MITVTGTIRDANGALYQGSTLVQVETNAPFNSGSMILARDFNIVTGSDGIFSTIIAAGEYLVNLQGGRRSALKRVRIRVPASVNGDSDATVTIEDVRKAGVPLPAYFGGLPNDGGGGGISVDTSGVFYAGVTALRDRTVHTQGQMAYLLYADTEAGGGGGWFGYVSALTTADDSIDFLTPSDITEPAPGRWKRLT
jgi:hypothetical protein